MIFSRKLFLRLYNLLLKVGWAPILFVLLLLFFSSWASMAYFENGAPIARKDVFWWYFVVTSTTVGYGDFSPATLGGRITGACIMLIGIGLIATGITKIAESTFQHTKKRMKGKLQLDCMNHLVILGYTPGKTEALVKEILADSNGEKKSIVLCTEVVQDNPMPDMIEFVFGKPAQDDTLARACVAKACSIIVYGPTDNDTLSYGIAANFCASEEAHIVAYFHEPDSVQHLQRVDPRIECVTSVSVPLIVHAMQDPGTARVIEDLVSHDNLGTSYRINVPKGTGEAEFIDLFSRFKSKHNVTLIGVSESHNGNAKIRLNPRPDFIVTGDMSLFYIGDGRLNGNVNWGEMFGLDY